MFQYRPLPDDLPKHTVDVAKAKLEAELLQVARLEALAVNLSTSNRLPEIINAAGDGITTEETLAKVAEVVAGESDGDTVCTHEVRSRQRSPTPDPEAWIPPKRTPEETVAFDAFFREWPRPESPIPQGTLLACKLDTEAMQIIE
jgi:hypothetical protein